MKDGAQIALTNTNTLNYSAFTGVENFFVRVYDRALQDSVTLDPLACLSITNSITITTVSATAVTFSSNATNRTFCTGESIDFEVTFPAPALVTNYEFIRSSTGQFKDSASATATLSDLIDGENIIVNLTLANGCTASTSMTMIENAITAGTISPALQTVCSGNAPNLITSTASPAFAGGATVTYEWQSSTSNLFTTLVRNLGANETYQPLAVGVTTFFRRVDIVELNNKTCSQTTLPVEVRINTGPGGVFSMGMNGAAVCTVS
jgi:hypothetical protein